MIPTAIGLGLVVSLVFTEALGLAAGGMVVPGYIALALTEPWRVVAAVVAAIVTFLTIRLMARYMLLYGRRHLVMSILVGFLFTHLTLLPAVGARLPEFMSFEAVGYVIPGLIAYWMERQGALATLASMMIAAVLVRLALVVVNEGVPIEIPTW